MTKQLVVAHADPHAPLKAFNEENRILNNRVSLAEDWERVETTNANSSGEQHPLAESWERAEGAEVAR